MKIGLSRVHFPVTTLGPGQRLGIWFQGCSLRCAGCLSADTWATASESTTVAQLLVTLQPWLSKAQGVTISGGEPFEQPEALLALLQGLKRLLPLDILVYSGLSFEAIQASHGPALVLIDALISDPFQYQTPQTLALRGSDNQRLHLLTALGEARFYDQQRLINQADQALDIMFDADGTVWLAGIPKRDDLFKLQAALRSQGHQIQLTADKVKRS